MSAAKSTLSERPCVELREYQTLEIPGVSLTWRDERLLRRLGEGEAERRQLDVRQTPSGVEVRASFWVGVASFDEFEVHVQPKLIGSEEMLIEMIDYATNAFSLRRFDAARTYASSGTRLPELFALMLADACERLARDGLVADYVEREELVPAVRGRILADRQVLKRFGVVDRVWCRFDEREQNIVENQLLLHALQVAYRVITRPFLKDRLLRLVRTFQMFCDLDGFDLESARRMNYHRLNERYRNPHGIAWVILNAAGLDTFHAAGKIHSFSFFINMNTLFERFVEQMTRDATEGLAVNVRTQFIDRSVIRDAATDETYRTIRPDILVESKTSAAKVPIDAKYKLYDQKRIATGDIYQLYFYGRTYNESESAALLVYPSQDDQLDELLLHDATGALMGRVIALGVNVRRFFEAPEHHLQRLRTSLSTLDTRLDR